MKAYSVKIQVGQKTPEVKSGLTAIIGNDSLRVMVGNSSVPFDYWRVPFTVNGRVYEVHPAYRDDAQQQLVLAAPPPLNDPRAVILVEGIPVRKDGSFAHDGAGFETCLEGTDDLGGSAMIIMEPNSILSIGDGSRADEQGIETILYVIAYSFDQELRLFPKGGLQDALTFLGGGWPLQYM